VKPPEKLVDTCVIIYSYFDNGTDLTTEARNLVHQARAGKVILRVPTVVVQETIHVMRCHPFRLTKQEIKEALIDWLSIKGIEAEERDVVFEALRNFEKKGIDFVDAYLAARSKQPPTTVVASDNTRDFVKLGASSQTPKSIVLDLNTTGKHK
jgi:predicted nucleic-acid-binding protein